MRQRPGKKDNGIRLITALPGEAARSVAVQLSEMKGLKTVVKDHKLKPIFDLLDTLAQKMPKLQQYKSSIFLVDRDTHTPNRYFNVSFDPKDVFPKPVPSTVKIYDQRGNDGLDLVCDSGLLYAETYLTAVANPDAKIVRRRFTDVPAKSMTLTQIQSL